jgi:hypothetical protein
MVHYTCQGCCRVLYTLLVEDAAEYCADLLVKDATQYFTLYASRMLKSIVHYTVHIKDAAQYTLLV